MINPANLINSINEQVGQLLPDVAKSAQDDIHNHIKAIVTSAIGKLDLVTREDYDVQMEVLRKTRDKIDQLEARVAELEAALAADSSN